MKSYKAQSNKKIKRKKFFTSVGSGLVSYFVLKSFPFNLLPKKKDSNERKVTIEINPHAVSRKNVGGKNV